MCYNPIEDDVVRAKNQLKAAILFSQDNLSGMCFRKLVLALQLYIHCAASALQLASGSF